jgi:group I intron endonuclease
MIYNFKLEADSMKGYKHTEEAILKMKNRFKNKLNHPFYGKHHTLASLKLISKPGILNPMYGRKHKESTKILISQKIGKLIEVYDIHGKLLHFFESSVKAAEFFGVYKGTIGRYIKSGKVFLAGGVRIT